jgi:hypothetical protein
MDNLIAKTAESDPWVISTMSKKTGSRQSRWESSEIQTYIQKVMKIPLHSITQMRRDVITGCIKSGMGGMLGTHAPIIMIMKKLQYSEKTLLELAERFYDRELKDGEYEKLLVNVIRALEILRVHEKEYKESLAAGDDHQEKKRKDAQSTEKEAPLKRSRFWKEPDEVTV